MELLILRYLEKYRRALNILKNIFLLWHHKLELENQIQIKTRKWRYDLPVETVLKLLHGSETDDGIDDNGRINWCESVNDGDDNGILLTVITEIHHSLRVSTNIGVMHAFCFL